MNCSRLAFVSAIFLVSQAGITNAQVLRGRVIEAKSPTAIPGVFIRVLAADSLPVAQGVADDSGRFAIEVPKAGEYRIELSRIGYALRLSKPMKMAADQVYELNNIQLAAQAVPVAAVPVTAESRVPALERNGFYARRKAGLGHYIDRATIEKKAPRMTTDLFAGVSGVRLQPKSGGGFYVLLRGGAAHSLRLGMCSAIVFVDGVPVNYEPSRGAMNNVTPYDFDVIHPDNVEAIEVYRSPAEVPPQYGGAEAACGVILLWRRVGPG
jgi:hypothetical protein